MDSSRPVFPSLTPMAVADDHIKIDGMSLRDWFAGQALVGLVSRTRCDYPNPDPFRTTANLAYLLADRMLKRSNDE